jgi:AcrR family transcriptional regulator
MGRGVAIRSSGRPRDERADEAIIEAALRQLFEEGYGRVTMESVAAEAGVARATVYRRYRDKADLITAAIAAHGAVEPCPEPSADPRGDLIRFLEDFDGRFTRSSVEVLGSLLANREDPQALALHRERVIAPRAAHARSLLERARELGELRLDADLDLALEMLVGVVIARAVSGAPSRPGWAKRALETIWVAMGTRVP